MDHQAAAVGRILGSAAGVLQAMAGSPDLCAGTARAAAISLDSLRRGGRILLCGNGGSAADAQHWAAELVSRFLRERQGLAAIALTTDSSILTAIGNDYGYDRVFARQIEALGRPGDVLFAISTSGRSANVLRALEAAQGGGLATVGFAGRSGGAMAALCDVCLCVPSDETPRIQEGHEVLGHAICGLIEDGMLCG